MCLEWLDFIDCEVKRILLLVDEKSLKERLTNDIEKGVRLVDVAVRSIAVSYTHLSLLIIPILRAILSAVKP